MTSGRAQVLQDLLTRVREGWPGSRWEWDGRLACALSTIGRGTEEAARERITAGLPTEWNRSTVKGAPALVQRIAAGTGGLLGSQFMFTADLPEGGVAYCLWWPWGSGAQISARIGATGPGGEEDLTPLVRKAFGL